MREEISSKGQRTSTELLVISDLKQEFVSIRDSITYATRLRILLRTLNSIRKIGLEEKGETIYVGPIDRLQTIHSVRWTVIEENRKMLLAVTFDSSLETYVRRIVDVAGPVLDAILCHCTGYENHTCWKGYEGFGKYVEDNQIDVDFYGMSSSNLTVDDIIYLTKLENKQRSIADPHKFDEYAATMRMPTQSEKVRQALKDKPEEAKQQALDLLSAMYRLNEYFPGASAGEDHIGSDQFYLQRLTEALIFGFTTDSLTASEKRKYKDEVDWLESFETGLKNVDKGPENPEIPAGVQGGILSGYGGADTGCLMLLQFTDMDKARAFLADRKSKLSIAGEKTDAKVFCNFSLTYKALKSFGLGEPVLRKFPKEFREGMEARAGQIGDMGRNYPKNWKLPKHIKTGHDVKMSSVDMVVQLQGFKDKQSELVHSVDEQFADWQRAIERHDVELMAVETLERFKAPEGIEGFIEHFGYLDGVSQPHVRNLKGQSKENKLERDEVSLGDVFLGYASDRDAPSVPPKEFEPEIKDLFNKGSFLVIRKLYQNVEAFNRFVNDAATVIDRPSLEAKMMGRYTDGEPLLPLHVTPPDHINDFDYEEDPKGIACPVHAHTRRTNPRDPKRSMAEGGPVPRIVRRGFSYGSPYSQETASEDRGLFFMAYNASIAEQFEVIQNWINGDNSSGGLSKHFDAIVAARPENENRTLRFVHDDQIVRLDLPQEQFVDLQWGLYLFVPSLEAIDVLCRKPQDLPKLPDILIENGTRSIFQLHMFEQQLRQQRLPEPVVAEKVKYAWKALLEDPSGEDLAEEVWAKIRFDGGVMQSPYGVLVGDMENVLKVFRDDGQTFSTREYWERMRRSIGPLYLGLDPSPAVIPEGSATENETRDKAFESSQSKNDYCRHAPPTNKWIADITEERAFGHAVKVARKWFADTLKKERNPDILELKRCIVDILGELSVQYFGLPTDGSVDIGGEATETPNVPDDLVSASHYFFGPRPTEFVVKEAQIRGIALNTTVRAHVDKGVAAPGSLHEYLLQTEPFAGDNELITRTIVGCVNGFVAASRGSFLSVMRRWIGNEKLWKYRQMLFTERNERNACDLSYAETSAILRAPMVKAMQKRSRPNLLHRVAVQDTELGGVKIKAGQVVVVSLQSAAEDAPGEPAILFGGNHGDTTHGCSGQWMALGVLQGVIAVIMEQEVLEYNSTFTLSLTED